MENIELKTETIQLDQFLKWLNLVATGGEAKIEIQAGNVSVNGEVEERRSKKLKAGDIIKYENTEYKIIS